MNQKPYFNHIVIEIKTEKENLINNLEIVESKFVKILQTLGITVENRVSHQFTPQGFTIAFVLSASHLAIHS